MTFYSTPDFSSEITWDATLDINGVRISLTAGQTYYCKDIID